MKHLNVKNFCQFLSQMHRLKLTTKLILLLFVASVIGIVYIYKYIYVLLIHYLHTIRHTWKTHPLINCTKNISHIWRDNRILIDNIVIQARHKGKSNGRCVSCIRLSQRLLQDCKYAHGLTVAAREISWRGIQELGS